ncbi:ABC-type oligopeptide transporter ABCB9 [Nelusetta ayraudi]|uniref:ABC-type oligopeptide transporter ABCB9 n=2 Tax=Nelusetta ayraudi TaxID=303726 RepID=UPI003F705ED0
MALRLAVGVAVVFALLDLAVTTVLYTHGLDFSQFWSDTLGFSMTRSSVDVWAAALLRAALLLGASLGVLWNREAGPGRVARLLTPVLLLCMVVVSYSLAKLLLRAEEGPLDQQPWFLSLVCWTCASTPGLLLPWNLLGRSSGSTRRSRRRRRRSSESSTTGSEDTKNLVEAASGEEQGSGGGAEEKQKVEEVSSSATLGRLLSYCRKDGALLLVAFTFLSVAATSEVFIPYFYGKAIDSIVVHKSMQYLAGPLVAVISLAVCSSLAAGVRGGVFTLMFARLNLRIRNCLFRALMKQEIGFFDDNHTGDIISRLSADTTQVSDLISQNVNVFLRSCIKALGHFAFMWGISWKLTLVAVMGFPFIGLVSQLYGDYYKRLAKEVQTTVAEANKVAEETVSSMRTVRSFANEGGETESYQKKLQLMFQLNKKQALAYACFVWCSSISELGLEAAIIYYGGHLVITDQMSGGDLIAIFIYILELGECFQEMASVYTGLMQGVGGAEKVFEYMDREPRHPAGGAEAPETCSGLVEFKDVTFAYPTRPNTDILKGVSFTLRPGEVTALVGPSGSGKSSCVSLLENFYRPQQGQVLLDGRPVHTLQHGYLHSKVSLVGQEPVLFARTVEENIAYGLSDTPSSAVVQAAIKANAHDFISTLPEQYQTCVGEKGTHLSGGQKQRVAIARALIRQPRVLILDEATSALDAESEHTVQQALNSIMTEYTMLVVAHRLSTVEKAHNIVVMDKGGVAEQGSHAQLMAAGGLYSKLVQKQLLGVEAEAEPPDPLEQSPPRRRQPLERWSSGGSGGGSDTEPSMRY